MQHTFWGKEPTLFDIFVLLKWVFFAGYIFENCLETIRERVPFNWHQNDVKYTKLCVPADKPFMNDTNSVTKWERTHKCIYVLYYVREQESCSLLLFFFVQ